MPLSRTASATSSVMSRTLNPQVGRAAQLDVAGVLREAVLLDREGVGDCAVFLDVALVGARLGDADRLGRDRELLLGEGDGLQGRACAHRGRRRLVGAAAAGGE